MPQIRQVGQVGRVGLGQVGMPQRSHDRRYWLRMFGWSIIATVTAVAIFSGATWSTPWRELVAPLTTSFVFTASIMPIAA